MKQRKLRHSIFVLLPVFVLAVIVSCSEEIVPITIQDRTALDSLDQEIAVITDDLTQAQIARDSLKRVEEDLNEQLADLLAQTADSAFADVHYTVQVTDGSLAYSNTRVASLAGALVSVSQGNVFQEVTTDGTGFATFPALDNGFISVTVELAGFSDVYLVVDLGSSESGDSRNVATEVMVFPTTGNTMFTVTGTSYYNQDLNNVRTLNDANNPQHPFEGLDIYEIVPTGTSFIVDCTPSSIPNNIASTPGFVVAAVYAGLQRVATSDASGNWTLTLPVVLLTDGTNLFSYDGPKEGDQIRGTQINVTPAPDTEEVWVPTILYPSFGLTSIQIFPGGNSVQDLYYFPL